METVKPTGFYVNPTHSQITNILSQYENGLLTKTETVIKLYAFYPNEYLIEELFFQWPELQEELDKYMSSLCTEL